MFEEELNNPELIAKKCRGNSNEVELLCFNSEAGPKDKKESKEWFINTLKQLELIK